MCSKDADLWCDWPACKRRKDGEDPKPFSSSSNLKQHMKGHTREGLPECRLCNKKFVHRKDADKCDFCFLLNPAPGDKQSCDEAHRRCRRRSRGGSEEVVFVV